MSRDRLNQEKLKKDDWKIITIWQCQIKNRELFEMTMKQTVIKIRE
jgi:G:T-mismatch repair DNA endonuclease (very short patch repair protein)